MLSEFTDRQAANADLYELEDIETGQKRQCRIVSKATVTVPGTDLNKATLDPILAEIAGKLSANGGTMTGNYSGTGSPVTPTRIGHPNQIDYISAMEAHLNSLKMYGGIFPDTTGTRNLGSSSLRWNYVYGNIGNFGSSVNVNGRNLCENKVLWSGSYYMNSSQTATLSEAVSAQPHGIVLAFNAYYGSVSENAYNHFFVPKYTVTGGNRGYSFFMSEDKSWIAAKYLYISDTKITGHDSNASNSTSCGITFTNTNAVLRYVIGV